MDTPNLLLVCLLSFTAVLVLLSVLAVIMRLLLIIFPVKLKESDDSAVLAAITTAYGRLYPGTRITHIGEQK